MKKATPVLVLFVLFLASFTGNDSPFMKLKKTDCEELNLKGRIQAVSELVYDANVKSDKVSKASDKPIHSDSVWFDEYGNKVNEKVYNGAGRILTEWAWKYDEHENLLEYQYSIRGKQKQKDSYTYDSAGRMASWTRYIGGDTLCEKDTYLYDAKGHQAEQDVDEHYPVKKNFRRLYTYDLKGNRVEEHVFALGSTDTKVHTWKYNDAGKITEEDDYSPQGRVSQKVIYKYQRGRLVEKSEHLSDGSVNGKEVYTYNSAGYKTEYDIYNNLGKLFHYYQYSYDSHGNITQQKEYKVYKDEGAQMEQFDTYELTYDKKGNWVKSTDFKMDGTVTLTERDIQYY